MDILLYPIVLPFIGGIFCTLMPRRLSESLAIIVSCLTFIITLSLFLNKPLAYTFDNRTILCIDNLNSFISIFCAVFTILTVFYSIRFMEDNPNVKHYYAYLLWTLACAIGTLLANNLLLLLIFWGFLGLTLYLLINISGTEAAAFSAKKTFIIVGGSDAFLLLGIIIFWFLTGTTDMDMIKINLCGKLSVVAFLSLCIAAFAKAGAFPVHTWIPDMAESAPVPVTAFLPASLDKLLGIYLLARVTMNLFVMNYTAYLFLLVVGAVTIIAAVMMAMIQHNLKKLLAYHAVSQVGYMVLGVGTGTPIGIAGGIFHMINHSIYKSCLFLCGGAIEYRKQTADLDRLGGLAKYMPITFITCLISALSISGIPPFNGFFSKWMVYQGIIELGKKGIDTIWFIWLVAAMFGSALTLASFMKLIHSVFFSMQTEEEKISEVSLYMWLPMAILASLCIIFGIFATAIPLNYFIFPAIKNVSFLGFWTPGLATVLIILGIVLGIILYKLLIPKEIREVAPYIGGEIAKNEMKVSGVEFYKTIKDLELLSGLYKKAERGVFDIYELGKKVTFYFNSILSYLHNGVLLSYLVWCLIGLIFLFYILSGS